MINVNNAINLQVYRLRTIVGIAKTKRTENVCAKLYFSLYFTLYTSYINSMQINQTFEMPYQVRRTTE